MPNLTRRSLTFFSADPLPSPPAPGDEISSVETGSTVSVSATTNIFDHATADGYCGWAFVCWTINGVFYGAPNVNFTASGNTEAIAWYDGYCVPGGGGTNIATYAFSKGANRFLKNGDGSVLTPIAAATPSGAWTAPDGSTLTVDAASGRTITAKGSIGDEPFKGWVKFVPGNSPATTQPNPLTLAAGAGGRYIAYYGKEPFTPHFPKDIFDLLERQPGLGDLIPQPGDPAPFDRRTLAILEALARVRGQGAAPVQDVVSTAIAGADRMDRAELEGVLSRIKSEQVRLEQALKSVKAGLKKLGG